MIEPVIIGNATLYCGDCLEILPTLGMFDMVFTDPPYGHNNNDGDLIHNWEKALGITTDQGKSRPIQNDSPEKANAIFRQVIPELYKHLRSGVCCCCCGGGGPDPQFARWSLLLDAVFNFKQMVVWDKGPMGMGWHYRRSYEVVLVVEKPGKSKWYDDTHTVENIIRPGQFGIRKILPSADDHPTPKPWQLAAHFMRLHTLIGDTVLDPFMGGGSTGEACINTGRSFVGIELDKKFFDQACRRIEDAQRQKRMFA